MNTFSLKNMISKKFCAPNSDQKCEKFPNGFTDDEVFYFMNGKSCFYKMYHFDLLTQTMYTIIYDFYFIVFMK